MKKFLAIFLAAVTILSMATMCISAYSSPTVKGDPGYIDYLDFSNIDDRNRWAERYEEDVWGEDSKGNPVVTNKKGELVHTKYGSEDYKNSVYPAALLQERYTFDDKISYTFKENGEVAVFTANSADTAGMAFKVASSFLSYTIGAEDNGHIEYVKMRVKNNSASSHFSIGAYRNFGGNSGFDTRTVATVEIEPNMGGWTTYTFSARDLNFDQDWSYDKNSGTHIPAWNGQGIQELCIFPFGYGADNQGYEGAEIEIDYVVFGSFEYVTNYESALEEKENSATDFDVITPPATTKYYTGDKLDFEGFEAQITLKDKEGNVTKETINSASSVYNFEKPEDVDEDATQWPTKVQLKYGNLTYEYTVTVIDVESVEIEQEEGVYKEEYNKIDLLNAGKFTPAGLSLKVNFADGTNKVKKLNEFKLEGTDFTVDVPLSDEGYYEYIITANYYGNTKTFLVKLFDLKSLELTPVTEKANAIYYGTELSKEFFDIQCVYTNGTKVALADSGLEGNFTIQCDTAIQGGEATATAQIKISAYNVNVTEDIKVNVQTPSELEVKLSNASTGKISVDSNLQLNWFTISYKYEDGTRVTLDNTDPNLIINYDTSAPSAEGEQYTGKVKIGDLSAPFNYAVSPFTPNEKAETAKAELANRGTVKLLAPKFPTFWLVTIIVVAVIAVLVAAFCVLKFVFKVEFKPIKKFDLDEIF